MNKEDFNKAKNLGCYYSYYVQDLRGGTHSSRFEKLLSHTDSKFKIDGVSVLQVLNRYFMFGDRTIFQKIKREPWMGYYESEKETWSYYDIPDHGESLINEKTQVADTFFALLCKEVKIYVGNKKNVGILLSGGMDSRIVAGVLHSLIESGEIAVDQVIAYTWGVDDCRDVVYSKRIADLYGWQWKHYTVDSEDLWDNFIIAGERGCEHTGLHLHAIPQISRSIKSEVDVMLAGSYGDSVGRAEYSGKHVTELGPVHLKMRNPSWFLKSAFYNQVKDHWKSDIEKYHTLFPRLQTYQQRELDYQIHYMRRMLNPCMELINDKVEMYQVFTHPKVFGYMWSLDPKLRNDNNYKFLLEKYCPELLLIPWARTGLTYPNKDGVPDRYKKKHHQYSKFMHEDLIERIESRLSEHSSLHNGIINHLAVKNIVSLLKKKQGYNFDYLEKIAWLISFTYLFDKYEPEQPFNKELSFVDKLNAIVKGPFEYRLRHGYRMVRKKLS